MNLKKFFIEHCNNNKYEINQNQLGIIKNLKNYYTENFQQKLLSKIFGTFLLIVSIRSFVEYLNII